MVDELAKANPTAVDDQSWTALHYAAQNGHIAVVQSLLIMDGINVDTSYNGITMERWKFSRSFSNKR